MVLKRYRERTVHLACHVLGKKLLCVFALHTFVLIQQRQRDDDMRRTDTTHDRV